MAGPRKKAPLGRNLDALLGKTQQAVSVETAASGNDGLTDLPVDQIEPGRYQPRTVMDPERLEELAESIKSQGLIQPVVVRPMAKPGRYELIAGERRWRATQMAGLATIPAIVRAIEDESALALALIENIQREDLNPLEEATSIKRLIDEFSLTHAEAAHAVGRSRAAVSNLLRLLELEASVREWIEKGQLNMGHARALLGLSKADQAKLARRVVDQGMSVRQTEQAVRAWGGKSAGKGSTKPTAKTADVAHLEQELTELLCAPIQVRHLASGKGQVVIGYTSLDELDGLLARFRGQS
jgi:ParB family chromosome partitioning protein